MSEVMDNILSGYRGEPVELIPILQRVQKEFTYLPDDAMRRVARFVGVAESRVYAVASFYAQFRFTPTGKNRITVCTGTACHVRGAQRVMEEFERRLDIKDGETTKDLEYTLETAACLGCCGLAPAVVVNETTFGGVTSAKITQILNGEEGASQ